MYSISPYKQFICFGGIVAVFILLNLIFDLNLYSIPSRPKITKIKYESFYKIENIRSRFETSFIDPNSTQLPVKPSIFCIIKTHPNNIAKKKSQTVLNVWGRKCDNYRFISLIPPSFLPYSSINITSNKTEEIEISKPYYILQPRFHVNETHAFLTDKLYRAIESVYLRFPNYDWYYISDDDAYVNVNNLKIFLKDKNQSNPVSYGFEFKILVKGGYHSGGPGYVVSGEAFRRLGKQLVKDYSGCKNSGIDDVDINDCLRMLGTRMEKSVDEKGRQRWICIGLIDFWSGNFTWLYQYSTHPLKKGVDCCSDLLIGAHYMSPKDLIRLDIAIEVQQNILNLYNRYVEINKSVTFLEIIKNYARLLDFEEGTNRYHEIINY